MRYYIQLRTRQGMTLFMSCDDFNEVSRCYCHPKQVLKQLAYDISLEREIAKVSVLREDDKAVFVIRKD